ncbi:MAG TPA: BamA/TamA family outer membrane protein [Flavitalea sp.]|nr:BamA/TamA family outer membrane protein [Flavitalea sp.]
MSSRIGYAFLLTMVLAIGIPGCLWSQDSISSEVDLRDKLREWFHKPPAKKESTLQRGKLYKAFLPIIGYTPAYGFLIGTGISANMLLGDPKTTTISTALANINFTTKEQVVINLRTSIVTNNNNWVLQGDYRMLFYSQPTYGLGTYFTTRPPLQVMDTSIQLPVHAQDMRFNYVRLYQTFNRLIGRSFYLGLGYNLDYHYNIRDEDLDTSSIEKTFTDHSIYSITNGFDQHKYVTSGLVLNGMWDSRDHPITPHRGTYANVSIRVNPKFLGSSQSSTRLSLEYKAFFPMSKSNPNYVLGFFTWQSYLLGGEQPYLALPSITWDMYNRSGRGYIQGRFRGENFFYTESEFRFPILPGGILSGVGFLNVTSAGDEATKQSVLSAFAPGYGAGVRIKLDKKTKTNISIDYGRGREGSSGVYFNLQETF